MAEALITLLIVCVIALVSAPVITKRAKKLTPESMWVINRDAISSISPAYHRDLKLGTNKNRQTQGIIVIDTLEFKDRNGNIIGWIKEDGTSSFASPAVSVNDEKYVYLLEQMGKILSKIELLENPQNSKSSKKHKDIKSENKEELKEIEDLQKLLLQILENRQ